VKTVEQLSPTGFAQCGGALHRAGADFDRASPSSRSRFVYPVSAPARRPASYSRPASVAARPSAGRQRRPAHL